MTVAKVVACRRGKLYDLSLAYCEIASLPTVHTIHTTPLPNVSLALSMESRTRLLNLTDRTNGSAESVVAKALVVLEEKLDKEGA